MGADNTARVVPCKMKVRCGEESSLEDRGCEGISERRPPRHPRWHQGRALRERGNSLPGHRAAPPQRSRVASVYDTEIVAPEYSLGGRRADYALCHPPREPVILVEVKQVGQSKGADRQLFEYAFHKGVPMAVLTDGQEWNFFLPTEQGDYNERQLYKLDILERDPQQAESSFKRYLEYEAVRSGQAIEAARKDYCNAARKRQAQRTLPDAWAKLTESEDELLIELLSDKVEDLCGVKPDPDAVATFLHKQSLNDSEQATAPTLKSPRGAAQPTLTTDAPKSAGYELYGQRHRARSARDVLIQVLGAFADRDPSFLERFAALPKHGRKRRYLARTTEELYPGSPTWLTTPMRFALVGGSIPTRAGRASRPA